MTVSGYSWLRRRRRLQKRGLSDHLAWQLWQGGDENLLRDMEALSDKQLRELSKRDAADRRADTP